MGTIIAENGEQCYTEGMTQKLPKRGNVTHLPEDIGRFRARETLEQLNYDPIRELVELNSALQQISNNPETGSDSRIECIKTRISVATKLLPYFTEKIPSFSVAQVQSQHIIVRPAEFLDPNELGVEGPSQPPVLDILGILEEDSKNDEQEDGNEQDTDDEDSSNENLVYMFHDTYSDDLPPDDEEP